MSKQTVIHAYNGILTTFSDLGSKLHITIFAQDTNRILNELTMDGNYSTMYIRMYK
jgi:hypothetical protein